MSIAHNISMDLTKIDIKDLRPFTASEFKVGSHYFKKDDGSFETVSITEWELTFEKRKEELRFMIKKLCKEGRLFVRINKPWKPFEI